MNKLVSGAIGVEIRIDGTTAKINLPDVLDLKNKRIKHIDACTQLLYTPSGRQVADARFYLSLVEQNTSTLKVDALPDNRLPDNGDERMFINKIVDLQSSYITLQGTPSDYTGKSIFLLCWFDEPMSWGNFSEAAKVAYDAFEVPILSTGKDRYVFGENRTLYNREFRNLLLLADYTNKTPKGYSSITATLSKKGFVTLQKDNYQFFQQVPLYLLNQVGAQYPLRLQNVSFDFTNSFIEFAEKTGLSTSMSVFFNVIIDDTRK